MKREILTPGPGPKGRQYVYLATSALVVASLVLGVIFVVISFQRPYMGLDIVLDEGTWVVDHVDPTGLAYSLGIQQSDRVSLINDLPVSQVAGSADYVHATLIKKVTVIQSSGDLISAAVSNTGPAGMPPLALLLVCPHWRY